MMARGRYRIPRNSRRTPSVTVPNTRCDAALYRCVDGAVFTARHGRSPKLSDTNRRRRCAFRFGVPSFARLIYEAGMRWKIS